MAKQIIDYGEKQLNDYKGFEIWKIWDITITGEKVNIQYQVADNDDAIDFFDTLKLAKQYIDNVLV